MTKRMSMAVAFLAVLFVAFVASAGDESPSKGQWARFKTGEVSLTLLDSNGVLPLKNAEVKVLSSEDNKELAVTVSDASGRAVVTMAAGRYLLNISGRNLAVVEFADDATLTSCRVVVPAQDMMVGGYDWMPVGDDSMLLPVTVGSTMVMLMPVYENNDDDDGGDNNGGGGNGGDGGGNGGGDGGGGDGGNGGNLIPNRSSVVSPR